MSTLVKAPQISNPESPYRDCAVTINNMILDHKSELGFKIAYDYDPWIIPSYPCTAIEFLRAEERIPILGTHALGNSHTFTYDFDLFYNIWYYHERISKELHDKDMETMLANINVKIFKTHISINGYACPGYSEVTTVDTAARERENCTLFAGYLTVRVPRRICYDFDKTVVPSS